MHQNCGASLHVDVQRQFHFKCAVLCIGTDFIPSSQVVFLALSSRKLKQPSKLTHMFKVIV